MTYQPIVVYEDNHLLIVCKQAGEIVQGDKTGDVPMVENLKQWLKEKYQKPGNVFLGLVNRLDRPVAGLVIFAKTSKALTRMNAMLQQGEIHKTYWAVVTSKPSIPSQTLEHHLVRREEQNKSLAYEIPKPNSKKASLTYRHIASGERYHLLEIDLHTGRHHQIRCQLAKIGCTIKGDLKYGAPRSNPDASISLLSRRLRFVHPVSGIEIDLLAPLPHNRLWSDLASMVGKDS